MRRRRLSAYPHPSVKPFLCNPTLVTGTAAQPHYRLCPGAPLGTGARINLLSSTEAAHSGGPSMEDDMLYWALVFFIIAIIAAFFGFGGVATTAASIAQILFFVFLVIFVITLVMGVAGRRRPPV